MALFFEADIYTDEGVIPETSDNFTLKFGTRNIHFLVLIISYEYHAAKTYFVTYLRDLVLEILRFSWYFGRCYWFFWGCSWFLGGCSGFSGECSWFSGGVPGFLGVFRVFWGVFRVLGGVPGFLGVPGCSGVPVLLEVLHAVIYGPKKRG